MSANTLPLDLFKANLELQLRVSRLLLENGQRWLEAASRSGADSLAESGEEIENLLKTEDWQALATLTPQAFWTQIQQRIEGTQAAFQQRIENTRAVSEVAAGNQAAFTEGLQQAAQDWQKTVTEAFEGVGPVPQPFQNLIEQWGAAWTAPRKSKATGAKGGTGRGN
ncbi:hypothetical protein [Pseudothauera rhizosphaerae]|uniref:Phasin protein n=1 Tax=Pseudothauera rhizosphaerae TaxID=2565932 RepID=A0A4S4APS2_9RHOO|nr:hypothetical protein [Pseudothauera rhizosphaerae]THF61704.1 hypothetical protein E6O51_09660 [Pseudothauera rhizosphaerae]